MVSESVHVATTIDRPLAEVYEYVADPRHLSAWAAGLAHQDVEQVDGHWVAESPMGRVTIGFTPPNELGVLDHDVTLPSGETVHNAMRVVPNGDGCDVVFTVQRRPEMDDAAFAADAQTVQSDLETLRSLLER
jgi:hypothetical protein